MIERAQAYKNRLKVVHAEAGLAGKNPLSGGGFSGRGEARRALPTSLFDRERMLGVDASEAVFLG